MSDWQEGLIVVYLKGSGGTSLNGDIQPIVVIPVSRERFDEALRYTMPANWAEVENVD